MKNTAPNISDSIHNVPDRDTALFGRSDDVEAVVQRLSKPECRLLTLVGAGGVGKTRLAIHAAHQWSQRSALDAHFVPLQPVNTVERLLSVLADTLQFPQLAQNTPKEQLLRSLRDKSLLLLLDNFEQLLPVDGALFLAELLAAAPGVSALVTSREVLNLREEWLYPLRGLAYPTGPQQAEVDPDTFGAVALFADRARRIRPDFSLEQEQSDVIHICQLVEGLPLALELAASWTKTMPCAHIAGEIQSNLHFLTTSLRNVPEQHRSMRAVFEHSWSLLTEEEQHVFKRLTVFRGSFGREAAERVARASLVALASLVDKSLLHWEAGERYQIHELLRQFAAERLHATPQEAEGVHHAHCAYFATFLQERKVGILRKRQRESVAEIATELDNVRAAWQWAIDHAKVAELHSAVATLDLFYQIKSRYVEGAETFASAAQRLEEICAGEYVGPKNVASVLGELLVCLGWYGIRLGRLEDAQHGFERAQAIFRALGTSHPPGNGTDPRLGLGTLANIHGRYAEADALAESALRQNEASGDGLNLMVSHYVLGNAALAQGQYERAREHTQQAYDLAQANNERWSIAFYVNDLGHIARAQGEHEQARQHYQAAYEIRREFGDQQGMAIALNHLGEIAWLQSDYETAARLHGESLAIHREIDDRGGIAASLHGLGAAYCAAGTYADARRHLNEALLIAWEIGFTPLVLRILVSAADLLLQTQQTAPGAAALVAVEGHPATDGETRQRVQQLRLDSGIKVEPAEAPPELDRIVATVQAQLSTPSAPVTHNPTAKSHAPIAPKPIPRPSPPAQPLVEPLTPRELEVLGLIAQGMTNRQIAETLVLAVGTVKYYTSEIYGKLGVHNRVQAVARARELELLD